MQLTPRGESRFATRVGMAVVHPQWALAVAGERRFAGRSGSDLIALIALVLVATQLRGLVGAVWLGSEVKAGLGLRAAVQLLTHTLTVDLAFLVLAALLLWLVAGVKRDLGRAFDLACVAAVPLLIVDLGATVVVRGFELEVPQLVAWVLAGIAWGWSGVLVALATRPARVASAKPSAPPVPVTITARRAGLGVVGLVVVGLVVQLVWIGRHLDEMRPVSAGGRAPEVTLPTVGPAGAAGPRVAFGGSSDMVTVVNFWATWCAYCLQELPELDKLARRAGVQVLAVNIDDAAAARELFHERGYGGSGMLLLADAVGEASERYGVSALPHTVVIDRAGMVREVVRGASMSAVEAAVEAALHPTATGSAPAHR